MKEQVKKKRVKFLFFKPHFNGRLMTVSKKLAEREMLAAAFEKLLSEMDLKLVGCLGKTDELVDLTVADFPELYSLVTGGCHIFRTEGMFPVQLTVQWFAEEEFESFVSPRMRVEVLFALPSECDWVFAEKMFLKAVEIFSPHWGELNRRADTVKPTFCTPQGNIYCVPHLGNANYFGPEYLNFFGGIESFQKAGFETVKKYQNGVFLTLGRQFKSHEAFLEKRTRIENELAEEEVFDPGKDIPIPKFIP